MKKCWVWLVMVAVTMVAVSSCADKAQELSTYWDGHDFTSLDGFDDIDSAEEKFDGYMDLLSKVPHEVAVSNMTEFLDSAAQNVVAYMVWSSWFEPYLHALQSPYRNDALFVAWLDKVLADKVIDDGAAMERLQMMRNVMELNVVGQSAEDVMLMDAEGNEFHISDLQGQRTLLMLLDADCPSCLDYLAENLEEYGRRNIRLIAVLVNGSPLHIKNISSRLTGDVRGRWTLAWCPGREIEKGMVYDLTLIPSRIMLDSNGIVEEAYY